jgi:S-adenosylmethionine:tRNA ribosyltransferase-isomerase
MAHPKHLSILDFTYNLPNERIANYPLQQRDLSKLLIYRQGNISEDIYRNIDQQIEPGTLLVFNNTKVVQARIFFENDKGATIEIFCLEPVGDYTEMVTAMAAKNKVQWKCMVGRASKWREKLLHKDLSNNTILSAEIVSKSEEGFIIELSWNNPQLTFAEILEEAGVMPIPPYIKRESDETDATRYQTVYAKHDGSVAAPTAGLHFSKEVLEKLEQKKIDLAYVTLHVGAGTFKPVKSETMDGHTMHHEWIEVTPALITLLINHLEKGIVAVGTTSMRTIESLYWMGVKALRNPAINISELEVSQWEPYETVANFSAAEALNALLKWLTDRELEKLICKTQIIIAPPYKLKVATGLVTNFHQPQSTLLLLVAAIVGDDWKRMYDYALNNNFRFLSYGDGSIIHP